jgi:hypothetical protein
MIEFGKLVVLRPGVLSRRCLVVVQQTRNGSSWTHYCALTGANCQQIHHTESIRTATTQQKKKTIHSFIRCSRHCHSARTLLPANCSDTSPTIGPFLRTIGPFLPTYCSDTHLSHCPLLQMYRRRACRGRKVASDLSKPTALTRQGVIADFFRCIERELVGKDVRFRLIIKPRISLNRNKCFPCCGSDP